MFHRLIVHTAPRTSAWAGRDWKQKPLSEVEGTCHPSCHARNQADGLLIAQRGQERERERVQCHTAGRVKPGEPQQVRGLSLQPAAPAPNLIGGFVCTQDTPKGRYRSHIASLEPPSHFQCLCAHAFLLLSSAANCGVPQCRSATWCPHEYSTSAYSDPYQRPHLPLGRSYVPSANSFVFVCLF